MRQEHRDYSALRWLRQGLEALLGEARLALEAYLEEGRDPAHLETLRQHLEQARWTLEMVELHGAVLLLQESAALVDALRDGRVTEPEEAAEVLMRAILQLPDYLEHVRTGHGDLPIVLLPLLNDLRTMRQADLLSESVLFLPDLERAPLPPDAPSGAAEDVRAWARAQRQHYQLGLLGVLRGQEPGNALRRMDRVMDGLYRRAREPRLRRLFWIASALTRALAGGGLEAGAAVKQLLGQLDRQIRRLIDAGETELAGDVPEDLVRNLLYYVGRARGEDPRVDEVRRAFQLDRLLPAGEDADTARETLGAPNPALMGSVSKALREELAEIKDRLDVFMHTGGRNPEELAPLVERLRGMADTLSMLGMGEARETALKEAGLLEAMAGGEQAADEQRLMQAAAELLHVESALDAAVAGPGPQGQGDTGLPATLAGLAPGESRAVLKALFHAALEDLQRIKEAVLEATGAGEGGGDPGDIPGCVEAIRGGLAMLELTRGTALMEGIGHALEAVLPRGEGADPGALADLAEAITAAECYLEALDSGVGDAQTLLEIGGEALQRLGFPMPGAASPAAAPEEGPGPEQAPSAEDTAAPVPAPEAGTPSPGAEERVLVTPERLPEEGEGAWPESFDTAGDGESPPEGDGAAPPEAVPDEAPPAAPQTPWAVLAGETDADILEVFLEEADEELERIREQLPRWLDDPQDSDALTTVRRAYHTLKGSGRLVGAELLGEFAWVNEDLLNRVLEGSVPADAGVQALAREALEALPYLVDQIRGGDTPPMDIPALMQRARDLARGGAKAHAAGPAPEAVPPPSPPGAAGETTTAETAQGRLDPVLLDIYRGETLQHLQVLDAALAAARDDPGGLRVTPELQRAMHTLNGSARTAGVPETAQVCKACEGYLQACAEHHPYRVDAPGISALEDLAAHVRAVLAALEAPGSEVPQAPELEARFRRLQEAAAQEEAEAPVQDEGGGAPEADATPVVEAVAGAAMEPGEPTDSAMENAAAAEAGQPEEAPDPELLEIFLEEASDLLDAMDTSLQSWGEDLDDREVVHAFQRQLHTLKGGARMAALTPIADLSHALESLMIALSEGQKRPHKEMLTPVQAGLDRLTQMVDCARRGAAIPADPSLVRHLHAIRSGDGEGSPVPGPAPGPSPEPERPVAPPADAAPMDAAQAEAGPEAQSTPGVEPSPPPRSAEEVQPAARPAPQEMVRVRSDVLDDLVNHAGEVNIYHARMEQEITGFGFNLGELEQTIARLRDQLRRLEMETEAQIIHRHQDERQAPQGGGEEEFDPLELDRYSNIQQYSRALAESVNDLASIHELLYNQLRDAETLLQQQSRVSTELQEGLMHTRMVQFATMVPRLRRVVRQTATELDRRVELEVEGEDSELDRSVLERMLPPLEHMLRNAIAHGIEPPDQRRAADKPEIGHIRMRIVREGAEVVLQVTDDGAGIPLERVREKVARLGLAPDAEVLTDHELMQYILESGFSTAERVNQISGRGVGMDVVNSEIKQLGGVLSIDSTQGRGTTFTVRLPFTLAISQALLVQTGDELYAVPLSSIEGIVRVRAGELAGMYAGGDPRYTYAGNDYEVKHLGALLDVAQPRLEVPDAMLPVLLVRSGNARIALQVDALMGSREVVIKSVGPQVAKVKGISGATILGDGRVVMILDIPALVRAGAGVQLAYHAEGEEAGGAEAGRATVLVVDDSITIRKVTARLLERHDFHALTAKDGLDALALLQETVPDLILLDIEMPRMDGFELAAHVRNDPRLQSVPIIMITSRSGEKHRRRAEEIGVDRYIGKPYQEADLLAHIRALLQGEGARD
ncbi:Hpt domain-containing protein [Ectothiorhodospira mobilis]|uniref:Hpt domain-containing protein n=1 Tax=Ectothiorhodospira mobilis TaxID=195064 RepID=UPI002378EA72|nr:Hpt domain-containing protein [Ectothiorhodospira mobilis]